MNFALIVTNLASGDAERAMLNIAALLAGRGHGVDLILLERVIEHAVPEGVSLHIVTPPDRRLRHGWLGKRIAAWRLTRLCKKTQCEEADRPDCLHAALLR